jgi:hypothetical protein
MKFKVTEDIFDIKAKMASKPVVQAQRDNADIKLAILMRDVQVANMASKLMYGSIIQYPVSVNFCTLYTHV